MGNKKVFSILFFAVLLFCSELHAQQYKTAIGVRTGFGTGLTVRHALNSAVTLEGIALFQHRGFEFTGLYELQNPNAFDVPRLNWYYGFGGHIGFFDDRHPRKDEYDGGQFMTLGIDGILGIEYNFSEVPINLSADWKPNIDLIGGTGFGGDSGAISVRYYF
jgi:hypothetical protein